MDGLMGAWVILYVCTCHQHGFTQLHQNQYTVLYFTLSVVHSIPNQMYLERKVFGWVSRTCKERLPMYPGLRCVPVNLSDSVYISIYFRGNQIHKIMTLLTTPMSLRSNQPFPLKLTITGEHYMMFVIFAVSFEHQYICVCVCVNPLGGDG